MNTTARHRTHAAALALALIAATGEARPSADVSEGSTSSCLVLEWMDPHRLLPAGEGWLADETLRILAHADIGARWERPAERRDGGGASKASPDTIEHRLRVVLVPSEPSGPGWHLPPTTFGVTVVDEDDDVAPPAVYIFYNTIVASLEATNNTDHRTLVRAGRALGRVVAHEVAHAIVPSEPHAADGLMRANLETRFLTSRRDVELDARWRRLLFEGMSELCSAR